MVVFSGPHFSINDIFHTLENTRSFNERATHFNLSSNDAIISHIKPSIISHVLHLNSLRFYHSPALRMILVSPPSSEKVLSLFIVFDVLSYSCVCPSRCSDKETYLMEYPFIDVNPTAREDS